MNDPVPESREPWRVGSRASRVRASHSYGLVLTLVVLSFLLAVTLPEDPWASSLLVLLQSAMLATALWTTGLPRVASYAAVLLAVVAGGAALVQLLSSGDLATGLVGLLSGVLVAATIVAVALGVVDQREVNEQSVTGATCVYLLLGLLFLFLYGAVAALGDGPLFAQGTDGTRSIRVYFSFVTLATLGYGDYTPAADLGRALAVIEALVGQLYLVTVMALLVSRLGGRRRRE